MAEAVPEFLQTGTYSAVNYRRLMSDFMRNSAGSLFSAIDGGVLLSPDLKVTPLGTAGLGVNIAAGIGYIRGQTGTNNGAYRVYNDGTVTKTITPNSSGSTRQDLVIAHLYDNTVDGLGQNKWAIEVITGTPGAGDPAIPAPASHVKLARVTLASGDTQVSAADITDLRSTLGHSAGGVLGTNFIEFKNPAEYGKKVQFGTAVIAVTTAVYTATTSVTFSSAFATTPRVFVTSNTGLTFSAVLMSYTESNTGFFIRATRPDENNFTVNDNFLVFWWAIGT